MQRKKEEKLRVLRYVLLTAAVLMIAAGAFTGEAAVVFRKASMICMECIGLG